MSAILCGFLSIFAAKLTIRGYSMRKKLCDIWMQSFNERHPECIIDSFLLEDAASCTYLLEDGKELRLTVNQNAYNFSKVLKPRFYKHVAKVFKCFKTELPDQEGNEQNVFCIISEHLKRDFAPQPIIQSGINLFRNLWCEHLSLSHSIIDNPYVDIENAYAKNSNAVKRFVVNGIKGADTNSTVKGTALALCNAYDRIKMLDSHAILFPYTDNIGLSENGIIKICNIGHMFMGLSNSYEIESTATSVTIFYDPIHDAEYAQFFIRDQRMLMPLIVDIDGEETLFLGKIDTGAMASAFSKRLYDMASLPYFEETKAGGIGGIVDAVQTACTVKFPNGYVRTLRGFAVPDIIGVDILIGMDLLAYCKFSSEPYKCGFKYKLTFP